jgi:hypothetical protein
VLQHRHERSDDAAPALEGLMHGGIHARGLEHRPEEIRKIVAGQRRVVYPFISSTPLLKVATAD